MNISNIPPVENGLINVIIETMHNSQNKFAYEPKYGVFKLRKTLPLGTVFPFDFGFIPNTLAEDGDPLDVLVIMEEMSAQGCLVPCRPIGILKAEQINKGKRKKERNDRIIAISEASIMYAGITEVKQLNSHMTEEIENFFIDYNKHVGKTFIPLGWSGKKITLDMIKRNSRWEQ